MCVVRLPILFAFRHDSPPFHSSQLRSRKENNKGHNVTSRGRGLSYCSLEKNFQGQLANMFWHLLKSSWSESEAGIYSIFCETWLWMRERSKIIALFSRAEGWKLFLWRKESLGNNCHHQKCWFFPRSCMPKLVFKRLKWRHLNGSPALFFSFLSAGHLEAHSV